MGNIVHFQGQFIWTQITRLLHKLRSTLLAYHTSGLLRRKSIFVFQNGRVFLKKVKTNKKPPYTVANSHIHLHFFFKKSENIVTASFKRGNFLLFHNCMNICMKQPPSFGRIRNYFSAPVAQC